MYEKELNEHKESAKFYNQLFMLFAAGAIILFFIGLLAISKLLIILAFIPLIIGFILMRVRDKHYQIIRDIENKQRMQILDERLDAYKSVHATACAAYQKVSDILKKPALTYKINVFLHESLQEITALQAEGGSWQTITRPCECWTDIKNAEHNIGALCILETLESFDAKVARVPNHFKTEDDSFNNVWRKYIPFSNILFFTVIGDVSLTSTVSGGDATYRGVSVNGIGFGEWEVDPIQIHCKEHDCRRVALIYKDCDIEHSLFFPIEMLPRLRLLIPQFDQAKNC